MKYLVKIHWSDEDQAFIAKVPALRGCISHGATYAEAAEMVQDAAEAWLASAAKHSDPIPEPDLAAEEIARMAPLLNVSKLARLSGVNAHTLATKLRRGTRFTADESQRILKALHGV
jgi:predicted RNase H-like HicB family nuclease